MAPVAAATSWNSSGATKSKTQSIASPGPAMKPSSDIDLFTTTLPTPVLVSLILFLRRTLGRSRDPFRRLWPVDPQPQPRAPKTLARARATTVVAPAVATYRLPAQAP